MNERAICFTMGQCVVIAIIVTGIICQTCDENNNEKYYNCNDQENLSDKMWKGSLATANKAYETPFVQQLIAGTLDPTKFGAYIVQDAVYLEKQSDALTIALKKEPDDKELGTFLEEKARKYMGYANDMYNVWQLSGSSSVKLNSSCKDYTDYKINIAVDKDPMYSIVAMIPCLRLWPYIGEKITSEKGIFTWVRQKLSWNLPHGVYTDWVNVNFNRSSTGYQKYEEMVDGWYKDGLIEKDVATEIYKKCMTGEYMFFKSALD